MADHRCALGKWALCHGSNAQHGVEQLSVRHGIQRKLLHRIRMLFHALLAELQDQVGDLDAAAADFLTSAALQADALNLLCSVLGHQEVGQQGADTAGVYLGAVYMAAYQRKGRTDIQTCTAADAVKYLTEILFRKNRTASRIVQDHCVEFLLLFCIIFLIRYHIAGTRIHGNIGGDPLACAVSRKGLEDRCRIL